MKLANQRSIARALGLTQAAVSLALRNDPSIPEITRIRVRAEAESQGYRPNPLVTTLMESIRSGREVPSRGCIAILVDAVNEQEWLRDGPETYRQQLTGYRRQAELRGYRTEAFYLRSEGASPESIDRQLYSRGITGVILAAPKPRVSAPVVMHWERYACSTVSYTWQVPAVDRVSSHHRHNMDFVFAETLRRGYKRVGFCLQRRAVAGVDANWMAGYLVGQSHLPKSRRLPPLIGTIHDTTKNVFRTWYERWKPDVIITLIGEELQWMQALGLDYDELGLVCLNRPVLSDLSGIDENNEVVGATACDIVVNQITHNERGPPPHPKIILIEGIWKEGASLPLKTIEA